MTMSSPDASESAPFYDVVVLGSGAAGLAAAITAARTGASVLVVEKQPAASAGGNTVVSGGVWFHHDDPVAAATYLRALSEPAVVREDVVDAWARETGRNSDWVRSLGGTVAKLAMHPDPEFPELPGSECYQGYWTLDGVFGEGHLHSFLLGRARDAGVTLRHGVGAERLVTEEGAVVGVGLADGTEVGARGGVVLATGGFAGSGAKVADHLGIPSASPWGSPHCTGDGLDLASGVGAAMTHLDSHMRLLGVAVPGVVGGVAIHVPPDCGFAFVDDVGRRFVDESLRNCHGTVRGPDGYERFAQGPFWLIIDAATLDHGPLAAPAPFGWADRMEGHRWSDDNRAEAEAGLIVTAHTWSDLARKIGADAEVLVATMDAYHRAAEHDDDEFARPASRLVALDNPPFAAVRCSPLVAFTGGGPDRDGTARVLDESGEIVAGLYAAGEVSSTYRRCLDGGMMIADALAFGRVAGADATERAANR